VTAFVCICCSGWSAPVVPPAPVSRVACTLACIGAWLVLCITAPAFMSTGAPMLLLAALSGAQVQLMSSLPDQDALQGALCISDPGRPSCSLLQAVCFLTVACLRCVGSLLVRLNACLSCLASGAGCRSVYRQRVSCRAVRYLELGFERLWCCVCACLGRHAQTSVSHKSSCVHAQHSRMCINRRCSQ
jgi:hypothetical protein